MHYYEWNDLIGKLLFNSSKAGQPVFLYLTREQIAQAAVDEGHFETIDEAWDCFTRKVRLFCRNSDVVNLTKSFSIDNYGIYRETINGISHQTTFPRFLSLLVLSVLPLTANSEMAWTAANYYDRTQAYLLSNGLPEIFKQNQSLNWNQAWESLEKWSSIYKRGTLGVFTACNANFNGHSYVGKPFSQCLIPPQALRDLPKAFVRAGWVPYQQLTEQHWQLLLATNCYDLGFRQAALKTLQTADGLHYAIPILQQRFDRWDGTAQTAASVRSDNRLTNGQTHRERTSKEDTYARFYLTFPDLDETDGRFVWKYRVRANQPLPDTLQLNDQTFMGQFGGWSSEQVGAFEEGRQGYDAVNKWRVKWPDASIRLLESGQWHGLSSRVWVEVNELSKVNRMWAICQPQQINLMRQWGRTFRPGQFKEYIPDEHFDTTDWPNGYGLFTFECPAEGIPTTSYILSATKQLSLVGGLRLSFGMYDERQRPQLQVVNGDGTEEVTAFSESGQQLTLHRHPDNPTRYMFVGDIPQQQPVCCRLNGTDVVVYCQFIGATQTEQSPTYLVPPRRNIFGDVVTVDAEPGAFAGYSVLGVPESRLHFIQLSRHVFFPNRALAPVAYVPMPGEWSSGDELLAFLTNRREGRTSHFFEAYEALLTKAITEQRAELPANVSQFRRWALGWYDTLGYLDYDYTSGQIRVLPPTLLPVPCRHGHRAIWVGGRSPELLARLRQVAEPLGVVISLEAQAEATYLAPSIVSIYTSQAYFGKAYSPIQQIAAQVGLTYLAEELPAWRLLERSGALTDYQASLQREVEAETASWTLRIFNPDRMHFERADSSTIDQSFALVERQLNAYEVVHYLWIDEHSYRVDKNWGRFLVLHQRGKQVIFRRERHNQIAVPATLPLPRVLARGFALLSGKIPAREEHNFDGVRRAYLLYENAGNILSGQYIQKLGQQLQSTNL